MVNLQREGADIGPQAHLFVAGIIGILSACASDGISAPDRNVSPTRGADAAALHLPGDGIGETPDFDNSRREPTSIRSEQITSSLDDLRRQLMGALLSELDASVPPGNSDTLDAGNTADAASGPTTGNSELDAGDPQPDGSVEPPELEPLDAALPDAATAELTDADSPEVGSDSGQNNSGP
jgi:hypothetical protein